MTLRSWQHPVGSKIPSSPSLAIYFSHHTHKILCTHTLYKTKIDTYAFTAGTTVSAGALTLSLSYPRVTRSLASIGTPSLVQLISGIGTPVM